MYRKWAPPRQQRDHAECFVASDRVLQVRKRGCTNITHIFHALGTAVKEFLLFLQGEEVMSHPVVYTVRCSLATVSR